MNDNRYARLRYTVAGALAALAAAGAIAGATALAAKPHSRAHGHAATAKIGAPKTPTSPAPTKTGAPPPSQNPQVFLNAIQQLVDNGTITAAEGQVVDSEIEAGQVDTDALASSGLTQVQIQAVQQALSNVKSTLAAARSAPPPTAK